MAEKDTMTTTKMTKTPPPSPSCPPPPPPWHRRAALIFLAATSTAALVTCPHSKVEESFNVQATHDLYYHGLGPAIRSQLRRERERERGGGDGDGDVTDVSSSLLPYDHLRYPGVVPRTFVGPFVVANLLRIPNAVWMCTPLVYVTDTLDVHPNLIQFLSRLILLGFNLSALGRLADASSQKFDSPLVGTYFLLVCGCQFHLPFYMSRMLPNVFALFLVVHCYADWMLGEYRGAAFYLVAATTIFRCDLLILLFTVGLTMLLRRELGVADAIRTGLAAGMFGLTLCVPLDTILWQRPVWAEGEVLWFNAYENRSSEWGESPWHWYFASALPRALLLAVLLVPLAFVRVPELVRSWRVRRRQGSSGRTPLIGPGERALDAAVLPYLIPTLSFVGLYSILPHKEVRFIFPAIPMLNVAAALGMTRLHRSAFPPKPPRGKGKKGKRKENAKVAGGGRRMLRLMSPPGFMFLCGLGAMGATLLGSATFLAASSWNYPGGEALAMLPDVVMKNERLLLSLSEEASPGGEGGAGVAGPGDDDDGGGMGTREVKVYIDVASAMSGITLFGQRAAAERVAGAGAAADANDNARGRGRNRGAARPVVPPPLRLNFTKGGYEDGNALAEDRHHRSLLLREFDYLLSEDCGGGGVPEGFRVVGVAKGFPRVDVRRFRIVTEDAICVLERELV